MFIEVIVNGERLSTEDEESLSRLLSTETTLRSEDGCRMIVAEVLDREGWPSPEPIKRSSEGGDPDGDESFESMKSFLIASLYADDGFTILEAEGLSEDQESDLDSLLSTLS